MPITTKVVSSNPTNGEVYSIQHGFELTTLVVIGIDCIDGYKFNCHTNHDDDSPANDKSMTKYYSGFEICYMSLHI
jgi:hypothetical protein